MNTKNNIQELRKNVVEDLNLSYDRSINDDDILRIIHWKRLKGILNVNVSQYLYAIFTSTDDIRFFNELLWIQSNTNKEYVNKAKSYFKSKINSNEVYPYCYNENFKFSLNQSTTDFSKIDFSNLYTNNICLIGTPIHFFKAFRRFIKYGVDVDIINIKYHPNKIMKLIVNNWLICEFYKLYFGKSYYEININKIKDLKQIHLPKNYDIGFHKLSFIIPASFINRFKIGLINDHWGALPLFKGRSTIDFSKLFGANVVVTNHLVTKEIDSGEIICFSAIDNNFVKKDIYFGLSERIINSIALLACGKTRSDINNKRGVVFYKMHSWLKKYVKRFS